MCSATSAIDNEISLLDNNVPQIRLRGPKCCCCHHDRLDIQRKDGPCGSLRSWNRERAIAATKFDDVAIQFATPERYQDAGRIEVRFPLLNRGHTAVSTFCHLRPLPI